MHSPTTPHDPAQPETACLFEDWFDPIESGLREKVRDFIEEMIRSELDAVLARPRYARRTPAEHADPGSGITGLPSAESAAMLFWALLASGQIRMRKVDGWPTLAKPLADPVALAASTDNQPGSEIGQP